MKADLYTAHARTTGGGGLAHRTDAGFVVLTSADGDEIIALIEDKQNEPDLIDHVVAMAQTSGPDAFAMLFTAGGELYVIASGTAQIALTSPSVHSSMRPIDGQVLVHALGAEVNETAANIRLQLDAAPRDARPDVDLLAGTVEADWVEVGIGGAVLAATRADAEVEGTADGTASETASAQPPAPHPHPPQTSHHRPPPQPPHPKHNPHQLRLDLSWCSVLRAHKHITTILMRSTARSAEPRWACTIPWYSSTDLGHHWVCWSSTMAPRTHSTKTW